MAEISAIEELQQDIKTLERRITALEEVIKQCAVKGHSHPLFPRIK